MRLYCITLNKADVHLSFLIFHSLNFNCALEVVLQILKVKLSLYVPVSCYHPQNGDIKPFQHSRRLSLSLPG